MGTVSRPSGCCPFAGTSLSLLVLHTHPETPLFPYPADPAPHPLIFTQSGQTVKRVAELMQGE